MACLALEVVEVRWEAHSQQSPASSLPPPPTPWPPSAPHLAPQAGQDMHQQPTAAAPAGRKKSRC